MGTCLANEAYIIEPDGSSLEALGVGHFRYAPASPAVRLPCAVPVQRMEGTDPAAVAASTSRVRFGADEAQYAVLSRDDVFADSLAGAALASDGPLLFTRPGDLPSTTSFELDRALAPGSTVYLLGGESAISAEVERRVEDLGYAAERLAGPSRVETAVEVARKVLALRGSTGTVAVARAYSPPDNPTAAWADSVTGGAWAAWAGVPLLVTPTEGLHPATAAALDEMDPNETVLLGGISALSPAVESSVPSPRRIAGAERIETAVRMFEELWAGQASEILVFNGFALDGWAYGLAGASVSATGVPLLPLREDEVPDLVQQVVADCALEVSVRVLGGEASVSEPVIEALKAGRLDCPS